MATQRISKITSFMCSLQEEANVLDKNVDELETGLRTALLPVPPEEKATPIPSCGVPLADGILDVVQILARINRKVVSLNKRLEL